MSPIEKKLHAALIRCVPSDVYIWDDLTQETYGDVEAACGGMVDIKSEVQIGQYRVDFLITTEANKLRLAIECDGHDWHERTKQQAAYDRARDRDLLKQSIRTARFTGSEIHHSAERCAADVFDILRAMFNEEEADQRNFMLGWDCAVKRAAREAV